MEVDTNKVKIEELLTRGVVEVIGKDELEKDLLSGKKLRVKLGIDPTSPNLHLGRSVPLLKMRDFQELGHKIVLIVGDFTGVIGDTSDKDSERPMLTQDTIEANKKTYFEQLSKLIDVDKAELRYNSEWLENLTYREIGEHADQFSVADFIARDNIKRRLDSGKRVSLREMLYPLLQGYDSVVVKADVELGGIDQRFNLLAGRTLQTHFKQPPQSIVTTTFPVEGLDGRKMSSSWGNTINFNDAPDDMYGKVMSIRDEFIVKYLTVLTRIPLSEVSEIDHGLTNNSVHPRDAKMRLAKEIVALYHGDGKSAEAEQAFVKTFQKGEVPDEMPTANIPTGGTLCAAVVGQVPDVESKSDLRRLINDKCVWEVGGEPFTDINTPITRDMVLKIGKRRFLKIIVT